MISHHYRVIQLSCRGRATDSSGTRHWLYGIRWENELQRARDSCQDKPSHLTEPSNEAAEKRGTLWVLCCLLLSFFVTARNLIKKDYKQFAVSLCRFSNNDLYRVSTELETPANGCEFFRPLKYRLRVDRLTPVNAWQPRRVRFHGVMPRNRFAIAPQE